MNVTWNADGYVNNFAFVPAYGNDVMALIDATAGSLVIDLGCGTGALTGALKERGYRVIGVDASGEMLRVAKGRHPDTEFLQMDALEFTLPEPADVIFSNAVFHWIEQEDQDALMGNIARNLKPGGQLVFEMGGKDCAETVHGTLESIFTSKGLPYRRLKYFPTIGEYAPLLEKNGFRITHAFWFERPTPQSGEDGAVEWIKMFDEKNYSDLDEATREEIFAEFRERTRDRLFRDGKWYIDYTRLRMRAVKL